MKCGICLAGGGVKGAAHIGALKALEEEGINIECISGTSSGSIVATLYAANYSTEEILNIFNKYSKKIKYIDLKNIINIIKRIFQERRFLIEGFNSGEIIENMINELCMRKGIDKVLCITFEEDRTIKKYKNIIDIVSGSISLMGRELSNYELNGADNILTIKTKEVSLLDFREINYLYTQGYSQTKKFLKKYLSNACSSTKLTCIEGKKL